MESTSVSVLLVDDSRDFAELLAAAAEQAGIPIALRHAARGEEALALLARSAAGQEEPPALVIVDVKMPGMDGPALLRAMRADARFGGLRVVAQSDSNHPIDVRQMMSLGCIAYLRKPMSWAGLLQRAGELARLAAPDAMAHTAARPVPHASEPVQ